MRIIDFNHDVIEICYSTVVSILIHHHLFAMHTYFLAGIIPKFLVPPIWRHSLWHPFHSSHCYQDGQMYTRLWCDMIASIIKSGVQYRHMKTSLNPDLRPEQITTGRG
jgi:hypothetical protein